MKITPITKCSNLECPNKASEGTMTITTLNTREDRPRNIVLILCGPCAEYMREAKADAMKVRGAEYSYPREQMKYPKLETPPHTKYYRFTGGPNDDQWRLVGHGVREVQLSSDAGVTRYYRAVYLSDSGISVTAFVHSYEFAKVGCKWRCV